MTTTRLEFSEKTKRLAYERTGGKCAGLIEIKATCDQPATQVDHIKRCSLQPDNSLANARPLCAMHHLIKTRMDAAADKKGRKIRRETKKSQAPKRKIASGAKLQSRNNLTKAARAEARERMGR
jgi:hypothetical protein